MRISRIISLTTVISFTFLEACSPAKALPAALPPDIVQPAAAEFTASNLTADPPMVRLGQTTKISVLVTGVIAGTYNTTVYLNVDGVDVKSQNVSLDSGASRNVTFYYFSAEPGTHVLRVGNSNCALMVHLTDPNAEHGGH